MIQVLGAIGVGRPSPVRLERHRRQRIDRERRVVLFHEEGSGAHVDHVGRQVRLLFRRVEQGSPNCR